MAKQKQVFLGFYAPVDTALALKEHSEVNERSISYVLRKALEQYLGITGADKKNGEKPQETPKEVK